MSQEQMIQYTNDQHFKAQIKEKYNAWDPQKKTILFIEPYGAVNSLLKRAIHGGHQVVVFTSNTDLRIVSRQVRETSHLIIQVDTASDRKVRQLGQYLGSQERIHAVIPGFEYFVPQAARLSRDLNLPGLTPAKVINLRSKYFMRQALKKAKLACPRFVLVKSMKELPAALSKIGFPAICKPVDAAGSVHVRKVNTLSEAEEHARRILEGQDQLWGYPLAKVLLVEEYISGPEYSAEGLIQDGKLFFYSFTEKFVSDQNEFIEIGHITNVPLDPSLKKTIEDYLAGVLKALEANHCPFHAEFRINEGGQPVLMEVAARLAGDRIADLIGFAHEVNYLDAVLANYLGEKLSLPELGHHLAGIRFFYRPKTASYSAIEGLDEVRKFPLEELSFYYKAGQAIPDFPKPLRRLGHAILKSDHYESLVNNLRIIDENLIFKS